MGVSFNTFFVKAEFFFFFFVKSWYSNINEFTVCENEYTSQMSLLLLWKECKSKLDLYWLGYKLSLSW